MMGIQTADQTIKQIVRKKRIIIPCAIFIAYTLAGFFLLPVISKNMITQKLSQALNRQVSVEKISINPFAFTLTVETFAVKGAEQATFILVDKIFANLSMASLFTFAPVVSDLLVENPYVAVVRNKDNSFNFSDLIKESRVPEESLSQSSSGSTPSQIPGFVLENFKISGGRISFIDHLFDTSHKIEKFSLSIPFVSSKAKNIDTASMMDIGFILNKAGVDIHVKAKPFAADMASGISVKTSDIDVLHYLSYFSFPDGLGLNDLDLNLYLKANYSKKKSGHKTEFEGRFSLLNASVQGRQQKPLIQFPKFEIDLSLSDILSGNIHVSKVLLVSPVIDLKRDKAGQLNLLSYVPENKRKGRKEKGKENPSNSINFALLLDNLDIQDAIINYEDLAKKENFKTIVSPLNIKLEDVRIGTDSSGKYKIDFNTEQTERFSLNGTFALNPLKVEGTVQLTKFILDKYSPFYEEFLDFDIKKGQANLDSRFSVEQLDNDIDMKIDLKEFSILSLGIFDRENKKEMIAIPELKISGSSLDLGNKTITTGKIQTKNGKIFIEHLKNGQINLVKSDPSPKKMSEDIVKPSQPRNTTVSTDETPWKVKMNSFEASGFTVGFTDLVPQDTVTLSLADISIKAKDLRTFGKDAGDIDISMNWNTDGKIKIKGSLIPSRLSGNLDIGLNKMDIKSIQPYFTEDIKILVTDGNINTSGNLQMNLSETPNKMLRFSGQTSLTDFVSLDKKSAKDFFKCNSLYLSGVDVSLFPVAINIKDISLTDFYSRIIVSKTGEINLTSIFKSDPDQKIVQDKKTVTDKKPLGKPMETSGEKSVGKKKTDIRIKVDSVTLQGGNINFSDYLTRPNFTASMKDIVGSVKGLSSDEKSRAKLHLKGLHGQSSPLDIVGLINPLTKNKFADIDIRFNDIELTNFTPYSSKYLGYKIEKGKLILDLEYMIDGKKLRSENKVRFDNFTLGERVESKDATSLPIGLAISLLKNRDGQIDLDLPVTGELDDPEFKVGSIIVKMITNLILKVVTSPFSIIGSMFGGGEDLGFVEFDYGKMILDDSNIKKLDALANILIEKPSVKLEIQGGYHPLKDSQTLKMIAFTDLIKAEKLKQMMAQGKKATNLKDVIVQPEEIGFFIEAAYANAQFPKPRDESGKEKLLDGEEKKKLLITSVNISADDLRLLAMGRSEAIKEYLMTTALVDKERMFLLEPKENDDSNTVNKTKAVFLLK